MNLNPYSYWDKKTLELIEKSGFQIEGSGMDQIYLDQAVRSLERVKNASKDKNFEIELGESSSTIIFSALGIEAILSEYITHFEFSSSEIPEELMKLRNTLDPMKKWKTLIKSVDPNLDLGSSPHFQRLNCLMDLRNALVHRQARMLKANEYPEKLENYMNLKVLHRPSEFRGSWILSILNYNTSKWAIESAINWIEFSSQYIKVNEADV